jgi:L1 cell adhesion molecule like protein
MTVIGIDLGTTYSSVGRPRLDGVELIPDGDRVGIPSVVAFQDGEWQVGRIAVSRAARYPRTTFFDTKRMLGCSLTMPAIQEAMALWPFPVVSGPDGEILLEVAEGTKRTQYHPWQISAKILEKLKKMAEERLGQAVRDAVISVPAHFSDAQREETRKAAREAGLNPLRLVNEPAVGAIAYGFETRPPELKTVLVFDFGGGTLDISVLTIQGKCYTVLAVDGDSHLGGRNIDARLIDFCLKEFGKGGRSTFDPKDPANARKLSQLKARCEDAKIELSDSLRAEVFIEDFHAGRDLDVRIGRADLERKCEDLFDRLVDPIEGALANCDKMVEEIDDIILLGGSSLIPRVKEILTRFFGKTPYPGINPLEAVARGATIMAVASVSGGEFPDFQSVTCQDICPLALGVKIEGERMSVIIRAGAKLPVPPQSGTFYTVRHNQTSIAFNVYEGPWLMVRRNRKLGSFTVDGIPPAEAEEEQVKVQITVERDGVLHATARVVSGTKETTLVVQKTGSLFSAGRVKRTVAEREAEKEADIREYDEATRKTTIEGMAINFRQFMEQELSKGAVFARYLPLSERQRLQSLIDQLLPATLGRIPTNEQIEAVRVHLRNGIRKYVTLKKNGMPAWL